ncbi:MAG: hypothetical protein M1827_002293 [Pycnora praestabilis]|nr:MAG: hypothetical protein M1827_002293 [Pycnora praestabilis]
MQQVNNPFPFQNSILSFATSHEYIGANNTTAASFLVEVKSYYNLNFLLTCRQIYKEASPIFFAMNGFEFYYISSIEKFLKGIGKKNREVLTKIRWTYYDGKILTVLKLLADCEMLNVFDLRLRTTQYCFGERKVWWMYPINDALTVLRGHGLVESEFRRKVVDGKEQAIEALPNPYLGMVNKFNQWLLEYRIWNLRKQV